MDHIYSGRILDGIDAHRVAEIIVESCDSAPARRGSGYRVTNKCVLTARHVVQGAQSAFVRFDADSPDEWMAVAVDWTSAGDMAILRLAELPADAPEIGPAPYGCLTDSAAVVEIHAAGFPRFKLREEQDPPTAADVATRYRDLHHAIGWSAVLSNRREGTLEVTVSPPERETGARFSSPWEGMSGAAVWVAGRIVGLVSAHDGSDGLGRLTVTRVDKTLDTVPAGTRNELRFLLGMQSDGMLADVTPGAPSQALVSAYLEQVRDMAPLGDLLDRNEELDKLVRFCASDDGYFWWQGGPWAGKTALMAWFATHLPAGIDAVSFFVTGRLSGQADSDAFTDVLIDQLSAITGQPVPPVLTPAARDGLRRRLLRDAADKSRAAGRRLVLVVDGLDEDTAARRGSDRPSIASLLPKQLLFGMKVVVASRSHPPIPTDVAADHPLRGCRVHMLSDSPYARDIKDQAVWELDRLLTSAQIERDIVGFITASGGGLTARDLNELTGQPPFVVDQVLDSAFGRSVRTGLGRFNDQGSARAYIFAHETLQLTAEDRIGAVLLNEYRDKINAWVDGYRDSGWPLGTPRYLLGGYARMLEQALDVQRLVACVTDSRRHARLFAVTGGDAAGLSEIRAAQNLILDQAVPDLESMARLSVHREHLYERNWYLPGNLPLVWAALGECFRAEALVRTIADPERQAQALVELVTVMAEVGNHDRAEAVARTIAVVDHQAEALAELATIIARAGDHDRAEALVRTIADPERQAQALAELVTIMAEVGNHDRAEALARTIAVVERRVQALVELSTVIAEAGDYDRAETLVRGVSGAFWKAQGLTALAGVAAQAGERDRCAVLVEGAESVADEISDPEERDQVLSDLAGAAAQAGDHRRAETLARSISQSHWRTQALVELATLAGQAGDFHSAEALVTCMPSSESQVELLTDLVVVAGQQGDRERAGHFIDASRDLVQRIPDPDRRVRAFSDLAIATARAGDHSRAEAMALAISDPGRQDRALVTCATTIAAHTGELGRAEGLIRSITDVERRAQALFDLAATAVQAGQTPLAGRLADDAEALARSITDPERRAQALTDLATASSQAGQTPLAGRLADDAEALARSITDPERRAQALTDLAT
ncbi:trypsin-like peptidase domain-containing protein, partial [Streptomyces sp. NPDC054783]